jgi:processive 1,2-diacylglycerol beta-glucosyltransferase
MTQPARKKILIVSLSTGSGHVQAGKALEKTATLLFPSIDCRHIDIAELVTPLLKRTTVDGYDFLISHLPRIWKSLFRLTGNRHMMRGYHLLTDYLNTINASAFLDEVKTFAPDHIITTHFLPTAILGRSYKKTHPSIPLTEIITDYGIHPIWIVEGIDHYIVSHPKLRDTLSRTFSIPRSQIHALGIPIDPDFETPPKDRATLIRDYGISPTVPVVLALSGGSGSVDLSDVLHEIFTYPHPLHVFAVAGKNTKLHEQISTLTPPTHITYQVLGWTDAMAELMQLSSVIIGKPGGLTMTESLRMRVPFIAVNPIPGQEDFNIDFLTKTHTGAFAPSPRDILPLLSHFLSHEYKTKDCIPLQSAQNILEFVTTAFPHQ